MFGSWEIDRREWGAESGLWRKETGTRWQTLQPIQTQKKVLITAYRCRHHDQGSVYIWNLNALTCLRTNGMVFRECTRAGQNASNIMIKQKLGRVRYPFTDWFYYRQVCRREKTTGEREKEWSLRLIRFYDARTSFLLESSYGTIMIMFHILSHRPLKEKENKLRKKKEKKRRKKESIDWK